MGYLEVLIVVLGTIYETLSWRMGLYGLFYRTSFQLDQVLHNEIYNKHT